MINVNDLVKLLSKVVKKEEKDINLLQFDIVQAKIFYKQIKALTNNKERSK